MERLKPHSPAKPKFTPGSGDNALATLKDVNQVVDAINEFSTAVSITAHAGGGQTLATGLIVGINLVTTATTDDSVILPCLGTCLPCNPCTCCNNTIDPPAPVAPVVIKNLGTADLDVYPCLGVSIDSLAPNAPFVVPAGSSVQFYKINCSTWASFGGLIGLPGPVCTDATLTGTGLPGDCLHVVSSGSLTQFGYFWQSVIDVAGTIASNNGKVLFQTPSSNNTAGFTMIPASGNITVLTAGIYEIDWSLSAAEPGAMCVYINATKEDLAGSTYGSGAGTQQNTGKTLLVLAANDVISLRTDNCPAALTLQLAGTTNTNQVVASIMLKKIG